MFSSASRSVRPLRVSLCLATLQALLAGVLSAQVTDPTGDRNAHGMRQFVERGEASTGLNRALGQPLWRYPALEPYVPMFGSAVTTIGFRTLGAFDPGLGEGGGNTPALDPSMPGDTILASHLDAFGLSFVGLDAGTVPLDVLNVPIHHTRVLVDEHGVTRAEIPCASDVPNPAVITRSAPCRDAVTLEEWMSARGSAHFRCLPGGAQVSLIMEQLQPNRLYTVWAIVEDFASGPEYLIRPVPFGGVPNMVISDRFGRASLRRDLAYCPHEVPSFLGIAVVMRSNGENFGGVPVPFLNQQDPATAFAGFAGLIPGTVAHVHLSFNVGGVRFDAP